MRVSVCLGAILIPEYSHSGYSAPRSRIARIYSGIYPYLVNKPLQAAGMSADNVRG